jgi:hypothetical protein
MNYKYPPIYKYILLLILFTTFLKYYKVITKKNYLLVVSIFVYMVFIFDYILVDKHPNLFDDKIDINIDNKKEKKKKTTKIFVKKNNNIKQKKCKKIKVIDDKIIKVTKSNISNEDKEMYDLDKELEEYNQSLHNDVNTNENLTDEIQRELDELNL